MKYWGPAFGLFFALPAIASAQIVINEVMYDPSGSNTGRQWIELYNQGSSDVVIVGGSGKNSWRVNDGSNHTITDPAGGVGRGSLTIPAGGYLILSSDPGTFVGEYPNGTYSIAKSSISLKSTGATISLLDGSGATVDSFTYTSALGAVGDGTSLQRTTDGSWITALPTPGNTNALTAYTPPTPADATTTGPDATSSSQTTHTQSPVAAVSSYVPPPTPDLYASAGSDRTVIAGADVEFDAHAYDKNQHVLDTSTVRFSWNFGDGSSAEGAAALHHFTYPGRYDVVLTIAQNKEAVADELIVTVEPAALSFAVLPDGGVAIENRAEHDLDLSNWIIREDSGLFAARFMLPDHSKILAGSSMNIAAQTLGFHASSGSVLQYPNGTPALSAGQSSAPVESHEAVEHAAAPAAVAVVPVSSTHRTRTTAASETQVHTHESDTERTAATSAIMQTASVVSAPPSRYLWWLGVFSLAGAAAFAIAAAAHFKKGEWDIIEETGD